MDAVILIATHGDDRWKAMGDSCFEDHSERFSSDEVSVVWHHRSDGTLAEVRNEAVDSVPQGVDWLCFVDADDFLEDGYFDAMIAADPVGPHLYAPAVRYGAGSDPIVFRDRNIRSMNPCVIGTLIHAAMFTAVGGFWEERAWEDWSLFRRAWLLGAEVRFVENAVYRANSDLTGRNSRVHHPEQLHREILHSHERWLRDQGAYA